MTRLPEPRSRRRPRENVDGLAEPNAYRKRASGEFWWRRRRRVWPACSRENRRDRILRAQRRNWNFQGWCQDGFHLDQGDFGSFLFLFLLPTCADSSTKRTRVSTVESLGNGNAKRVAPRIVKKHSAPGQPLQDRPMSAENLNGGEKRQKFSEPMKKSEHRLRLRCRPTVGVRFTPDLLVRNEAKDKNRRRW